MTINLLSLKNTLPFYIQPLGLFKRVTHKNQTILWIKCG
ncbi:hypothetical protein G134_939 [Lactobacillus delbrueckii subsp. lactis CRL581]|nr:hypothetical protein G134_939 [Lactobacillus delbrueckii subsp. lactis CRL581]